MKLHENVLSTGPSFDEHTITAQVEELTAQLNAAKVKQAAIAAETRQLDEADATAKFDLATALRTAKEALIRHSAEVVKFDNGLKEGNRSRYFFAFLLPKVIKNITLLVWMPKTAVSPNLSNELPNSKHC